MLSISLDEMNLNIISALWENKEGLTSWDLAKKIFPTSKYIGDKANYIKKRLRKLEKLELVESKKIIKNGKNKTIFFLNKEHCFVGQGKFLFKSDVSKQTITINMGKVLILSSKNFFVYVQLSGENAIAKVSSISSAKGV
jgi:hypothetical protein